MEFLFHLRWKRRDYSGGPVPDFNRVPLLCPLGHLKLSSELPKKNCGVNKKVVFPEEQRQSGLRFWSLQKFLSLLKHFFGQPSINLLQSAGHVPVQRRTQRIPGWVLRVNRLTLMPYTSPS